MNIIDLTHCITNNITVYPDSPKPKNKVIANISNDGYKETEIHMLSHNGTHMDSPNHVLEKGLTLDKIDVTNFFGTATLIDCSCLKDSNEITFDFIEKHKESIYKSDFIIFKTNWSKYWNTNKYLYNYPILSEDVINFIIKSNIKGIGIDAISVDSIDSSDLSNHHKLLKNNILILENLTNLDLINQDTFILCALPLKFENADGAPIRAIAILE